MTASWRARAACRGVTPLFFPASGDDADQSEARAVCAACPVPDECLDYALTLPVSEPGIYAGRSMRELRRMRTAQGRAVGSRRVVAS